MESELYLVDSSVWLDVLAAGRGATVLRERVEGLLAADRVATTGIVRLEVLRGAKSQDDYLRLAKRLDALHQLPTTEQRWDEAAQLGFRLRRQGLTVPDTDLIIAGVALAAQTVLIHRDSHFDVVAQHAPLRVESYAASANA